MSRQAGLYGDGPPDAGAPAGLRAAAAAAWAAGTAGRFLWVLALHPPAQFVYSDMKGYRDTALALLDPGTAWNINHSVIPAGNAYWLAAWYHLTGSWTGPAAANALLSAATPLLAAAAALFLFGSRTAAWTLILASLSFQFADQAGYFLAEAPFTFLVAAAFGAFVATCRARRAVPLFGLAALSGVCAAAALAFKGQALFPGFFVAAFALWAARRRIHLLPALAVAGAAAALTLAPVSVRATRLNEGRFSLVSTNAGQNFLMGHYGWRYGLFNWDDGLRGTHWQFGNPTVIQKGLKEEKTFPFGVYDQGANFREAWSWMADHPVEAVLQTLEHPFELFVGSVPWPTSATRWRPWLVLAENLYLLLVLLPAACLVVLRGRRLWAGDAGEWLVLLPILGNCLGAAVFAAEPRYRIPFDLFTAMLAARFYAGCRCAAEEELPLAGGTSTS